MRRLVWFCIILAVVVAGVGVLAFYGYSGVKLEPTGDGTLTVELNPDWPGSGRLIAGVTVDMTIDARNSTFVPLWAPVLDHELFVGDEYIGDAERTPSMWLGPRGREPVAVSAFVPRDALPTVILELILSGGNIDVTVESTATVAGVTFTIPTTVSLAIADQSLSFKGV